MSARRGPTPVLLRREDRVEPRSLRPGHAGSIVEGVQHAAGDAVAVEGDDPQARVEGWVVEDRGDDRVDPSAPSEVLAECFVIALDEASHRRLILGDRPDSEAIRQRRQCDRLERRTAHREERPERRVPGRGEEGPPAGVVVHDERHQDRLPLGRVAGVPRCSAAIARRRSSVQPSIARPMPRRRASGASRQVPMYQRSPVDASCHSTRAYPTVRPSSPTTRMSRSGSQRSRWRYIAFIPPSSPAIGSSSASRAAARAANIPGMSASMPRKPQNVRPGTAGASRTTKARSSDVWSISYPTASACRSAWHSARRARTP